jgi:hypothetical protein
MKKMGMKCILRTTIVNDMESHTVHTTHVPERCSNLA